MEKLSAQKGQSLVEVLIALAVTTIVILALVIVSLMGLKNAQFAQNQAKATKYAQEGIDRIKTLRDRNGQVIFNYPTGSTTTFTDLWALNMSNLCSGDCYFVLDDTPELTGSYATGDGSDEIGDGFTRQIFFSDASPLTPSTEKRVTAIVKWKDSAGDHESNIQTILTKH